MKKVWGIIVVLLVAVALFLLVNPNPSRKPATGASPNQVSSAGRPGNSSAPANPSGTTASGTGAEATSWPKPPANLATNAGMVEPATAAVPSDISPEAVLQNVRHAITQYGSMFGGNPVGTNPEITAALAGNNPKQINFIKPEAGMQINGNGELVDAWGAPLFFHQLSGTDMEVRSAGPDRKLWTPDDLVTR